MVFSVQQIKYEFLMYIKEFGGERDEWRVGVAADAPKALFEDQAVDETRDIWLWKPSLSPAAARVVLSYMTDRVHIPLAVEPGAGAAVYLYKRSC